MNFYPSKVFFRAAALEEERDITDLKDNIPGTLTSFLHQVLCWADVAWLQNEREGHCGAGERLSEVEGGGGTGDPVPEEILGVLRCTHRICGCCCACSSLLWEELT